MKNELHTALQQERKLALITGAAQRIGKAMAEHLAERGWDLAIHYNRSGKKAIELKQQISGNFPGGKFQTFSADLLNITETENLLHQVIDKMGKPALLINNASLFEPDVIRATSSGLFDRQMMVNFKAPFILTRDFANLCGKGIIINMTDTRITGNRSNFAVYTLAKKILWEFTKMAALELAPEIRVNAIAPGLALPPEGKGEEYLLKLAGHIPMKRPGGLLPVLKTLDFIIENDYLTGQLMFCDGGENLGISGKVE